MLALLECRDLWSLQALVFMVIFLQANMSACHSYVSAATEHFDETIQIIMQLTHLYLTVASPSTGFASPCDYLPPFLLTRAIVR
jgi:hypothetical protein